MARTKPTKPGRATKPAATEQPEVPADQATGTAGHGDDHDESRQTRWFGGNHNESRQTRWSGCNHNENRAGR